MWNRKRQSRTRLLELALHGLKASAESIQNEVVAIERELAGTARGLAKGAAAAAREYVSPRKRKRTISLAHRRALSKMMKARWAKRRKQSTVTRAAQTAVKTLKRTLSPKERKRRSERMKQFWAERKKNLKVGA